MSEIERTSGRSERKAKLQDERVNGAWGRKKAEHENDSSRARERERESERERERERNSAATTSDRKQEKERLTRSKNVHALEGPRQLERGEGRTERGE